jgi:DNA-binding transcriptional MocR family regulator
LRALYREKRDVMETALREHLGGELSWQSPRGGFFVWATLRGGCSDTELLAAALARGVLFVAGSAFFVDGSGHDTIRLSFSAPTTDRIREGMRRLASAVADACARGATARE